MKVERLEPFHGPQDMPLKWPNSVACFDDGRIAIADGGNDRVIVLEQDGSLLWEHGEQGFKPDNMREPIVVSIAPDQSLYVSDWHNHRILVFTPKLTFSHTLFHLGPLSGGAIKRLELFIKHLLTDKVGVAHYFKHGAKKSYKTKYSLPMLMRGLLYYAKNINEGISVLLGSRYGVRKANGITFDQNKLLITQKANRCISLYTANDNHELTSLIKHIATYPDGRQLGRMCNMSKGLDGLHYACDQNNWRIGAITPEGEWSNVIEYEQGDGLPMGPFACTMVAPNILVIARSFGFEIRDIEAPATLYSTNDMGETHGIGWHTPSQTLFYVDRSNSCVQRFKVTL